MSSRFSSNTQSLASGLSTVSSSWACTGIFFLLLVFFSFPKKRIKFLENTGSWIKSYYNLLLAFCPQSTFYSNFRGLFLRLLIPTFKKTSPYHVLKPHHSLLQALISWTLWIICSQLVNFPAAILSVPQMSSLLPPVTFLTFLKHIAKQLSFLFVHQVHNFPLLQNNIPSYFGVWTLLWEGFRCSCVFLSICMPPGLFLVSFISICSSNTLFSFDLWATSLKNSQAGSDRKWTYLSVPDADSDTVSVQPFLFLFFNRTSWISWYRKSH